MEHGSIQDHILSVHNASTMDDSAQAGDLIFSMVIYITGSSQVVDKKLQQIIHMKTKGHIVPPRNIS